jgi:hypothetical protein
MTEETNKEELNQAVEASSTSEEPVEAVVPKRGLYLPLPGLAAIGLYLAAIAGALIVGVVRGNYPPLFLFFPVCLIAATGGMMLLLRWAWALALAAVLLLAIYNMWVFSQQHVAPALVQGLLNWVFFLYLVRVEVRSKLR